MTWPPAGLATRRPTSSPLYAYLLDVDGDLADRFDTPTRVAARQRAIARVVESPIGTCEVDGWFTAARGGFGLLIIDGLLTHETRVADRTATQLLGPGDLLQAPVSSVDELLGRSDAFRALAPVRFALLDSGFVERIRPWPHVGLELLARSGRQLADLHALRAITSQPRLEVRLVMLLWHLAARWGRVEPNGIRITLPLTHRLLGQVVGAERPSISHALARLAASGLVTGAACDLHLHGTIEAHTEALLERGTPRRAASVRVA